MRSAIMDIGYNAIRAVVYENDNLGSPEIFNSKFKNDILNLLTSDSIDIKHQTYLSIQYLLHVFNNLNVTNIKCVATAVLRNHPRSDEFVKHIKNTYNFDIEILSGQEEARLTALGLMSGIENSNGIAADLGGGSLELMEVSNKTIGRLDSFELGTKILTDNNITKESEIIEIIKATYNYPEYENLYLIGGALRFIGRLYIDFTQYPLKNLHNLTITTNDFSNYLNKLELSLQDTQNKFGRRNINPNAIFVVKALISILKPKNIIISTYGLKEGVRIELMDDQELAKDIILEKVQYICNIDINKTNFEDYTNIINPLLCGGADLNKIITISIMLLSFQNKFDRTLAPTAISEFILSSEIPFTHKTRIMLALIASYATNYKPSNELIKISRRLITKEENNNCQIIGHFLFIAEAIDGLFFTRPSFKINVKNHYLEIDSNELLPRPIFEKICNRLKLIAFARRTNY